jgi:hypothetical protein
MADITTPITSNSEQAPFGDSRGASSVITKPKNITNEQFATWKKIHDEAARLGDTQPRVTANQAAIESGWFKNPSGKNNYFGIKAKKDEGGTYTKTKEEVNGKKVPTTAKFKDYNSITDAIKDRVTRFAPIYKDAQSTQEANAMIAQAGYATDSNYLNLLNNVDKMMGGSKQSYTLKPTRPSRQQILNNNIPQNNVAINNTRVAQPRIQQPEPMISEQPIQQPKYMTNNNPPKINSQSNSNPKATSDQNQSENYLGFINNYLNNINPAQSQMAMGGKISNACADGGMLNRYDEGGRHEENPLGGIPLGMGSNGLPNSVEEGETSFKSKQGKYIFSDRLKL